MRPTVKNRVAVFHMQGFIDGTNAPFFIPLDDIKYTNSLKVDMILISLKKVIYFNVNGLEILTDVLNNFRKSMKVTIGFCDYDQTKFDTILKFNKDSISFSLFQTLEIAYLFTPSNKETKKQDIIIWAEDISQRNALAIELFERGHNAIVAQSQADFNEKKKRDGGFDCLIQNTYLGFSGSKIAARVAGNAIIYTLKGFLDAELSAVFDLMYHTNCLNVDFKLFIFDATQVVSLNIHALNFFSKLASTAAEYDATLCLVGLDFVKTPIAYKEELEDAGLLFFDDLTEILKNTELMTDLTGANGTKMNNKRNLTKILINNLPNFIDSAVSSFEMMTNETAVKKAAAIQKLSIDTKQKLFASSIGFFGDLEGVIMLIFPVEIATIACKLLLDEEDPSDEDVLDTIAEFVNIIGGRVKAILAENEELLIDITLPRTYSDVETLVNMASEKKGVQIDLELGEQHFTFFLTP